MDASHLPARTSSPPAAAAGGGAYLPSAAALDANALQAACLAIQMQNQLQQTQRQAAAAAAAFPLLASLPRGAASDAERFLAQAALSQAHISPSVASAFQDSTSTSQRSLSPTRQTSAFSPIRAIGNPITATAPSRPQYAPPPAPLDMMLLQLQMAAAAAGLVQSPFSLLPSSSALGILAPHLRLQQPVNALGSLPLTANTSSSLAHLVPNTTLTSQPNPTAQTSAITCPNSALGGRTSNSVPGSPSKVDETSSSPLIRCYSMGKRQKDSLKRPYNDMAVLRSLCNDRDTPDASPAIKRQAKADENENDRRLLAAEVMASIGLKEAHFENRHYPQSMVAAVSQHFTGKEHGNSSDESLSHPKTIIIPTTSSGYPPHIPSGDPNSPNRHHPLNHRPPAMEARFLECMAAIALHSNFSLPVSTCSSDEKEDNNSEAQSSDSEKPPMKDETTTETESETQPSTQPNTCTTDENEDIIVIDDGPATQEEGSSIISEDDGKPDQADELTERLMHKSERKTWPTTAIDEELCKELENYKGTDVPMIHAYVIPPRSDTSSSSGDTPDERSESPPFHSVPSLAVPVPILNILLERILHTMLQT